MKRLLFILILIVVTGCAPTIKRIGYSNTVSSHNTNNCNPTLVKNQIYNSSEYKKIGEIKIDDSGFSINCEESDVIKILKDEACKCGADVVNIIKEKRADIISSCYRATAEFIKIENNDSAIVKNDLPVKSAEYSNAAINYRVQNDKNKKILLSVLGFGVGYAIGFLIFSGL